MTAPTKGSPSWSVIRTRRGSGSSVPGAASCASPERSSRCQGSTGAVTVPWKVASTPPTEAVAVQVPAPVGGVQVVAVSPEVESEVVAGAKLPLPVQVTTPPMASPNWSRTRIRRVSGKGLPPSPAWSLPATISTDAGVGASRAVAVKVTSSGPAVTVTS